MTLFMRFQYASVIILSMTQGLRVDAELKAGIGLETQSSLSCSVDSSLKLVRPA